MSEGKGEKGNSLRPFQRECGSNAHVVNVPGFPSYIVKLLAHGSK
jgi:hypothetical protein